MKTLDEIVHTCSTRIVEYIKDTHMIDLEEVEAMIGLHFRGAVEAMLRPEDQAITEELEKYMREQANRSTPRERRVWLNVKIKELSEKRRSIRRAIAETETHSELWHLKVFVREKWGQEALDAFYELEAQKPKTTRILRSATMVDPNNPDRVY